METREIVVGDDMVEIPADLCTNYAALVDILSPETWNNYFTDEHREHLMKFLPDFPQDDIEEKTKTLEMFFMQENFKFGTPITDFYEKLSQGDFDPAVAKMKKLRRKLLKKSYRHNQKKYYHNLLEDVLVCRQYYMENFGENNNITRKPNPRSSEDNRISVRATKRYMKEMKSVKHEAGCDSDLSDDDKDGSNLWLNKKQRRQANVMESTLPSALTPLKNTFGQGSLTLDLELDITPSRNPFDPSDEYFKALSHKHARNKKAKNLCSMDTRGISLQGIMHRSDIQPKQIKPDNVNFFGKSTLNTKKAVKRKTTKELKVIPETIREDISSNYSTSDSENEKSKPINTVHKIVNGKNPFKKTSTGKTTMATIKKELPEIVKIKQEIKEEDIKVEMEHTENDMATQMSPSSNAIAAELTQETHASFFSLLREVICSTYQQRMTRLQLENTVKTWQESAISPLNEWFSLCHSWMVVLPSAITFLCGNIRPESSPPDFVPYIEYKAVINSFQWIGAGRDSDANLEVIFQHWFSNRDTIPNDWPGTNIKVEVEEVKPLPSPRMRTPYTVKPSSDLEKKVYHIQEKSRYQRPHKAYTFRMHGYESVIGPVKGIYSEQSGSSSKARGHSVLVDDRPPYVTILSLVRDAVARLPNGEGSKTDICQLLKESQYINASHITGSDSALNSVISGALDRLQYGKDPSVKFDTSRKLWVYLHRNRTEEELERMHHLHGPQSGGKSKNNSRRASRKKEETVAPPPPNVSMEPFTPSIRQMDGTEVQVKAGDMLENWVPLSSSSNEAEQTDTTKIPTEKPSTREVPQNEVNSSPSGNRICVIPSVHKVVKPSNVFEPSSQKDEKEKVWTQSGVKSVALKDANVSTTINSPTRVQVISTQQNPKSINQTKKKVLRPVGVLGTGGLSTKVERPPRPVVRDPKLQGIKLVQYPNASGVQAKPTSIVVDSNSSLQALVGQKIVVPGNRLLLQGGKVIQTLQGGLTTTGILAGNKVLTGVLPGQHLVALGGLKSQEGSESNVSGGRFVQIAAVDPSSNNSQYQKVTIVPTYGRSVQKKTESQASTSSVPKFTSAGDIKLKATTSASVNSHGNNIITLGGGKQLILTSKGSSNITQQQLQQLVVADSSSDSTKNTGGKVQGVTQQIVLPASAFQGTHINLKRLQPYQSFKVIPASQVSMHQKGKPVMAQFIASPQSSSNVVTIPSKADVPPDSSN